MLHLWIVKETDECRGLLARTYNRKSTGRKKTVNLPILLADELHLKCEFKKGENKDN